MTSYIEHYADFTNDIDLGIHILDQSHQFLNIRIAVVLSPEESKSRLSTLKEVLVDACHLAQSNNYIGPLCPPIRLEEGRYAQPHTTHTIQKDMLPLWYKLLPEPEPSEDGVIRILSSKRRTPSTVSITCFANDSLGTFLAGFKSAANLMFVVGSSGNAMSLHDNWCNDDEDFTIQDIFHLVDKRNHSIDRTSVDDTPCEESELDSYSNLRTSVLSAVSVDLAARSEKGRELTFDTNSPPNSMPNSLVSPSLVASDVDLDAPLPSPDSPPPPSVSPVLKANVCVLNLVLARGHEMPAPTLRVSLHQTRIATDLYGKSYTIYNLVVKQGGLEWVVDHRYSGIIDVDGFLIICIRH